MRTPSAIWTVPHSPNDANISRDNAQCIWRRRWQCKYRLLERPRQLQLLNSILRGGSPAAAVQLVVHSIVAQRERLRLQLSGQRERCVHVAMEIFGRGLQDPAERSKALNALYVATGGWETGQRIKREWDMFYDIREDLGNIEGELRILGANHYQGAEDWED
ncbi:uncharacterized protein EKO05_0000840 [Ascochyta rabiei]|uniref:Uncharacterized protein n=1 Tax=Didymella rabiei TaxID=5454 RepID=A0A163CHI0_DIDRA|nr:uncharacterized protein EKO05_0000840 [Ascochyta rabiei]KZM22466.1 hypothetical protein ST47_g6359 [Ascochyta rabiei]UPX10169.1 hypothetical protein EKO05_0000840 [Ascochyta rabiei]